MDSAHHLFLAEGATYIGPPEDPFESERIGWVPLDDVRQLIDERLMVAGSTLVAMLYVLATR